MSLVPGVTMSLNLLSVTRVLPRLGSAPSRSFAAGGNNISLVIPKKPANMYIRFFEETRPAAKAANPHLKKAEIDKIVVQQWKDLDESKREAYRGQAKKDFDAWKEEIARLKTDPLTRDVYSDQQKMKKEAALKKSVRKAKTARKELEKENKMPKRPISGFVQYFKENAENWRREAVAQGIDRPLGKHLLAINASNWKKLPEEVKQKYADEHKRQLEIYEAEMNAWKEEIADNGEYKKAVETLSAAKKKAAKIKNNETKAS